MDASKLLIVGANGQLGVALRAHYPNACFADIQELDITNPKSIDKYDWSGIEVIVNAAAFTNVDQAETQEGRVAAWQVNARAVANLASVASDYSMCLVHISTDYVFDGTKDHHSEGEAFSPLATYGTSKAAGDLLVSQLDKYYIIRTSWVIGEGKNFVRTMLALGKKGINPTVVSDQIGRLTFTSELVRAIHHLLSSSAPFGTYNVSNAGESVSWADITREIFKLAKLDNRVTSVTTKEYFSGKEGVAMRPLKSTLSLDKITSTGFESHDWHEDLKTYIQKELSS